MRSLLELYPNINCVSNSSSKLESWSDLDQPNSPRILSNWALVSRSPNTTSLSIALIERMAWVRGLCGSPVDWAPSELKVLWWRRHGLMKGKTSTYFLMRCLLKLLLHQSKAPPRQLKLLLHRPSSWGLLLKVSSTVCRAKLSCYVSALKASPLSGLFLFSELNI